MKNNRPTPNIYKTTALAVAVNGIQLLALLAFVLYVLLMDMGEESRRALQWIAIIGGLMAAWGAYIDIQDALRARRHQRTIDELQLTNEQMDALNLSLRAQRHDFLNHIQVVYSLLEMQEYDEATSYLERIYTQLHAVGSVLRTKMAAFNALLQVKSAACEEKGVKLTMEIKSALDNVAVPPWELCCIIGNLLDNAMDACKTQPDPEIVLTVTEDLRGFTFAVSNNGDPVPEAMRQKIFEAGVSTKGENRGMGLAIVSQTLSEHGGAIALDSTDAQTTFTVVVPRRAGRGDGGNGGDGGGAGAPPQTPAGVSPLHPDKG